MEKLKENEFRVIYLGGPTIILEIGGLRIITDPTLDPENTEYHINDKITLTKLSSPPIGDLGNIDLVLLSHDQHQDNLDNKGRELLTKVANTITTTAGAARLKSNAIGIRPWEQTEIISPDGTQIVITATPARHGPSGSERMQGDVIGFILQVNKENEKFELYITGDTVFYEGIVQVAERFRPDYIFIFAGAAKPKGPFNVTMGSNDAIDTAHAFPGAMLIPLHHQGWSHYTENGNTLAAAFGVLGIAERLTLLEAGKTTVLRIDRNKA